MGHVLHRLPGLVFTVWLAVTLSFVAMQLVPGDPAVALLAPNAPPEIVQAERHAMGLDQPVLVRYAQYLAGFVRGDLGKSWASREPVSALVSQSLPATLQLALTALGIAVVAGIALGGLAVAARGTAFDGLAMALALLATSTPIAASGVLVLALFGARMGEIGRWLLPAVVLGLVSAGALARLTRAQLAEALAADYVRTARAKGLYERLVFARHALRNAMIPVASAAALQFGFLLGGTVLTEMVFSRPGMGRLLLTGIVQQDLPVVQGAVALGALGYALANLAGDLVQAWLDPRMRT